MKARILGVLIFLVLLIPFIGASTTNSCNMQIGSTGSHVTIDPSSPAANSNKVTISGMANGVSYSPATLVQINCNVNGASPAPSGLEIPDFEQTRSYTQYHYSVNCIYVSPVSDTDYEITASVDGVLCGSQLISVKGNGGQSHNRSTSVPPAVNPGTGQGQPSTGQPTSTPAQPITSPPSDDNEPPPFPSQVKTITVSLAPGWNLVGSPFGHMTDYSTDCVGNYYTYNTPERLWLTESPSWPTALDPTKGVAAYVQNECHITFYGTETNTAGLDLSAGWNLISPDSSTLSNLNNLETNCDVLSGPWGYEVKRQHFKKTSLLNPGSAYWIRVANACSIKPTTDQNLPPAMPGTPTPSPTPVPVNPVNSSTPSNQSTPTQSSDGTPGGYQTPTIGQGYVPIGSR